MSAEEAWFEVWNREYNTFDSGEWELTYTVKDRAVADLIVQNSKGWGSDWEVRGIPDPTSPEWSTLNLDDFNAAFVVSYGRIEPRTSRSGMAIIEREEREARNRKLYEEAMKLKPIGKKLP